MSDKHLLLCDVTITVAGRDLIRGYSGSFSSDAITVVVGPSGAGKSLWLRAVAGLIPADDATIRFTGDVKLGSDRTPRIGVVFQSYAVFDELTPIENVQIAIDNRPAGNRPAGIADDVSAADWLAQLGVPSDVPTMGLSGGQKQRLGIARTLASRPDLILYDEPTSGLDAGSARRVVELIRQTHQQHGIAGIIVTHDYTSVLPIADQVQAFDVAAATLRPVAKNQWSEMAEQFESANQAEQSADRVADQSAKPIARDSAARHDVMTRLGRRVRRFASAVVHQWPSVPTSKWTWRFFWDHLKLVGGPSALLYISAAGGIVGFVAIYFTFEYLPYKRTTGPLLIDDLIAAIGFALYRVLIPILATILIAARSGAALASSVGVKRYGGQIDAMQTIGVVPPRHLAATMMSAMIVTTPLLVLVSYYAAKAVAAMTFASMFEDVEPMFWQWHFGRGLSEGNATWWLIAKTITCGIGIAGIAHYQGNQPKMSAAEVSRCVTRTILWATLFVLMVHFAFALVEFRVPV